MRPNDGPSISREAREEKLAMLLAMHKSHGFEAQCECAFCHDVRTDPQEARAIRRATFRSLMIGLVLTSVALGLQIAIIHWAHVHLEPWRYATLVALCVWISQRNELKMWRRWWALRRYV